MMEEIVGHIKWRNGSRTEYRINRIGGQGWRRFYPFVVEARLVPRQHRRAEWQLTGFQGDSEQEARTQLYDHFAGSRVFVSHRLGG